MGKNKKTETNCSSASSQKTPYWDLYVSSVSGQWTEWHWFSEYDHVSLVNKIILVWWIESQLVMAGVRIQRSCPYSQLADGQCEKKTVSSIVRWWPMWEHNYPALTTNDMAFVRINTRVFRISSFCTKPSGQCSFSYQTLTICTQLLCQFIQIFLKNLSLFKNSSSVTLL